MNLIKQYWNLILEIKEYISSFKQETSGKESYTEPPVWPFPKSRPNNESDNDES